MRVDGSEDDFSYLSCVKGRERPTKGYLNDAMRRAILPQVLVFKEFKAKEFKAKFPEADGVNDFQCDECKIGITKSIHAHVDHVIEFNHIRDNFLEVIS